jgi:hypothetical protein
MGDGLGLFSGIKSAQIITVEKWYFIITSIKLLSSMRGLCAAMLGKVYQREFTNSKLNVNTLNTLSGFLCTK